MELNDDSAFRAYMLTGNNPQKLLEGLELDFDHATEEELQTGLQFLIDTWVSGDKNHRARNPEINGMAATFERGKEGTPHAHIYIACKNAIKIKSIKNRFPGFHIDILKGSDEEAKDYIYKRKAYKDKHFTQLCEPMEWGEYFCSNGSSGGDKMHDVAERYIRQGMTPNQIILIEPRFARFEKMVQALYNAYIQSQVPTFREVFVEWHLGKSGTGKTHEYLSLCDKCGADNVYLVSGTSKHPWDGYSETVKKVVIDELRTSTFDTSELLAICDGYKISLNARYRDRLANWDELHITSIISPDDLWRKCKNTEGSKDTFDQLLRRIDKITYHYIDESYEGDERYKRVSIPASNYRDVETLEAMAEIERLKSAQERKARPLFPESEEGGKGDDSNDYEA